MDNLHNLPTSPWLLPWLCAVSTHFRILFLIFLLVFTGVARVSFAGEPGTYQEQAMHIVKNANAILAKHGVCETENDCTKKKHILFYRGSHGIGLNIYNINELHIINELIDMCITEYSDNNQGMSITVKIYHQSHKQLMDKLFGIITARPFITIELKGGDNVQR